MESYKSVKVLYTTSNSNSQNGIAHVPAFPRVSIDNIHQHMQMNNDEIGTINIPLEFDDYPHGNHDFHMVEPYHTANQVDNSFPVFLGILY